MKSKNILLIGEAESLIHKTLKELDNITVSVARQLLQYSHQLDEFDLMIGDFSEVVSKKQLDRLRLQAPDLPFIAIIDRSQEPIMSTLADRIEDYIVQEDLSPVMLRYSIRHALERARIAESAQMTTEHLERVIEDQKILRRIERELGYTLSIDRVLNLAIDTAMRLTAASGCSVAWLEEDTQQINILSKLGECTILIEPIALNQLSSYNTMATVFREGRPEIDTDGQFSNVLIPLLIRGKTVGVLNLERIPEGFYYDQSDWEFLLHLSNRTATAIETARIYQRTQHQAIQLDQLYELSNNIAQYHEKPDLIESAVAGLANLLHVENACYLDFHPQTRTFSVLNVFTTSESLFPIQTGTVIEMFNYGLLLAMLRISLFQIRSQDPNTSHEDLEFLQKELKANTALLAPIIAEDGTLKGVIVLLEIVNDRVFTTDEIALARSFTTSVSFAIRKAELFADVQKLEQIKSEMIHMASHDLRTPLSRILLSLRILERKKPLTDPQQIEMISVIQDTTQQMQSLLEDILSLEKIQSDENHGWKHFNITETLDRVTKTFVDHTKLHQQRYIIDLPKAEITVLGNEVQLQQAFSNYISNAIKYTPKEGQITVKAYTQHDFLIFEAEDTGFGIPAESQERIFSRFYRAKTPGTEDIAGTGLGLSLVKTVIERHGGRVWFRSEVGSGSTFSCSVPIKTN